MKNTGQLPKYYAEGTHTPIITAELFEKAQQRQKQRSLHYRKDTPITHTAFSSLIQCPKCGRNYKRITNNGSVGWNCSTYLTEGKSKCHGKKIPESTLEAVTAEVLNLPSFDEKAVTDNVERIIVPKPNRLLYVLKNGSSIKKVWKDHSRRDSWTPEMKEKARQQALKRNRGDV